MSNVLVEKQKIDILANAISNKSGEPLTLTLDEMVEAVDGIEQGIQPSGNIDITHAGQTDVTNYATATVPEAHFYVGNMGEYYTDSGQRKYHNRGVATVDVGDGETPGWIGEGVYYGSWQQYKAIPSGTTITPTESAQTIGGANTMMEGAVTVEAVPSGTLGTAIGSWSKDNNYIYTRFDFPNFVAGYLSSVNPLSIVQRLQDETITPSTTSQTVTPNSNGYYLNSVTVNAMPSGTAGTPTATKGTVSNHSVSVTPSVTNTTGYITGGTKTGTAVIVSASELVSGTLNITSNGTKDVTNYASVSIGAGSVAPVANKGTVSNHTVSISPYADTTSGFIGSGRYSGSAVTVSASELVSGTKSITGNGTGIDVTNYASVNVAVQSGIDVPIFTVTFNQSTGVATVTCNKTYEQCEDLVFIDGESTAVVNFGDGVYLPLEGFCEDGTKVQYFGTEQGVPAYEIVYNGNGTITFNAPSSVLDTLNVTENGTYTPPSGKVYNEVVVNVSGGGSSTISVGKTTKTLASASSSIQFTGLSGNPTSFAVTSSADITTNTNGVTAVVFDGTSLHGQILSTQTTADTGFTKSYSGGTLTITATDGTFQANEYKLVYTYGGSTSDIETADIQVGSGATSITFSVTGRPIYWSCIFKSDFSTSSGYQRVIEVVNDGSSTYGMCLDSSAHASSSYWTASYSGGSLTISSQGTNAGGYFHQPGYYQLTYIVDESAPSYQTKTVTPTTSQQVVTADTGYDALSQVTVNAMPSMTLPSSTSATSSGTSKATISASSSTQYLNIPTGYNATAQYYTISASGGGGSLTVATKTLTNTATTQTLSFSSLSGQPKYWFLRATTNVSSSGSTTYYYVTDCFYDGTSIKGNTFRIGSTRRVQNITSGISQSYSGNTLTITAGSSSGATPGQFYGASNFGYELVYIY